MTRETPEGKEDYQNWRAPREIKENINNIGVGGGREIPIPPEYRKGVAVAQELLAGEQATMDAPEETAGVSPTPEEPRVRRERKPSSSLKARLEKAVRILTLVAVGAGVFRGEATMAQAGGAPKDKETANAPQEEGDYVIGYGANGEYVKYDKRTNKLIEEMRVGRDGLEDAVRIRYDGEGRKIQSMRVHKFNGKVTGETTEVTNDYSGYNGKKGTTKEVMTERDAQEKVTFTSEHTREYEDGRTIKATLLYKKVDGSTREIVTTYEYTVSGNIEREIDTEKDARGQVTKSFETVNEWDDAEGLMKGTGLWKDARGQVTKSEEFTSERDANGHKAKSISISKDAEGRVTGIWEVIIERDAKGEKMKTTSLNKDATGQIINGEVFDGKDKKIEDIINLVRKKNKF